MKKWLIILCLIAFPVLGQEVSNSTFNENNPNIIRDGKAHLFNGNVFVYIQGVSDKPQPQTWMDDVKLRLFGSMDIPQKSGSPQLADNSSFKKPSEVEVGVPLKDFFGTEKEIKYTPHTSDWNFIIQPMDSHTISVQENIQFLLTEDTPLVRSWPIAKERFSLIKAQIDSHPILTDKNEKRTLLNFKVLPAGLHKITLHYTLSLPMRNEFLLPLISGTWSLITDDFSGVILNGKIGIKEPRFLLGENLQEISQNFIFQSDEQGNIFFKNTHILPAFTQIQLSAQASDIAPQQNEDIPFSLNDFLIFVVTLIIILFYLILSGCEIYFASLEHLLKRFKHICKNPINRWFYRMGEVSIGCFILLISTLMISFLLHIQLSYIYWVLLLLFTITGIVTLDFLVFFKKQKMIYQLHENKEKK